MLYASSPYISLACALFSIFLARRAKDKKGLIFWKAFGAFNIGGLYVGLLNKMLPADIKFALPIVILILFALFVAAWFTISLFVRKLFE
jgi:hypothetical protein